MSAKVRQPAPGSGSPRTQALLGEGLHQGHRGSWWWCLGKGGVRRAHCRCGRITGRRGGRVAGRGHDRCLCDCCLCDRCLCDRCLCDRAARTPRRSPACSGSSACPCVCFLGVGMDMHACVCSYAPHITPPFSYVCRTPLLSVFMCSPRTRAPPSPCASTTPAATRGKWCSR